MNRRIFQIQAALVALCLSFVACSSGDEQQEPVGGNPLAAHTYRMVLQGGLGDYANTRAAASWADGTVVILQFGSGSSRLTGEAVYSLATEEWTVTVNGTLAADASGQCEAYYFTQQAKGGDGTISLSAQDGCYQDPSASFVLDEDLLLVQANLTPIVGRVRFIGAANTTSGLSGLTTYTAYNPQTNTFATSSAKLSVAIGGDGSSAYYYATFTDAAQRQLTVDGVGATAYRRTFADQVLAKGQSGYITLPSGNDDPKWELVNTDNMQEITLPVLSDVTASQLRSYAATLEATVTSVGNGRLSQAGFVYSTSQLPTLSSGTNVDLGTSASLSARLTDLQPQTTYYVRAYATNERGTAYSAEASFTTLSKEEDGTDFGREDYGEDEDLGGSPTSTTMNIGHEGYEGDSGEPNQPGTTGDGIGKTGFDSDENLGDSGSSANGFGKDIYKNDENWN